MDVNSDSSMLSDELKPRRTPVPSSFGDAVPRPSVPDLSIIEIPSTDTTSQANVPLHSQHPVLSHLSYNDWRLKTGGVTSKSMGSAKPPARTSASFQSNQCTVSSTVTAGSSLSQQYFSHQRGNDKYQTAPSKTSGKIVSYAGYADFRPRPTTAPVVSTQLPEDWSGRDHPLSKSAPPLKSSQQMQPSTVSTGHNYHAVLHGNPVSTRPQIDQNSGVMSQHHLATQNYQCLSKNTAQGSPSSASSHFSHMNPVTYGSINTKSIAGQMESHPAVSSREQTMNLPFSPNTDTVSHNSVPTERGLVHNFCPSECCQPIEKKVGHWMYPSQRCCPSTAAIEPGIASSHVHSIPPCVVQHSAPWPQVSYEDLYKVVLAQNDQLKLLQAQVERLLVSQDTKVEPSVSPNVKEVSNHQVAVLNSNRKCMSEESTQTSDCESKEDESQKMSIGVMTSFIHAVTYRGRVGRLDAVQNVSEHESLAYNGHPSKQSKSPSSDNSSSSLSPASKASSQNSCTKCCEDCSGSGQMKDRSRKRHSKDEKPNPKSAQCGGRSVKPCQSRTACPEGCNCNNPGVSAAITAVRGCQAVLESRAGMTGQEFSTFNGADLPTVTEQPVSPMSSIHVDLHEYRSSSCEEQTDSDCSESDKNYEYSLRSPPSGREKHTKNNGWTFYNNVLGQFNKILEEKEMASCNTHQVVGPTPKQTDISVSKRVAFEQQVGQGTPQNLKEMAIKYLRENHPEELSSQAESKKFKQPIAENVQEMSVYNMPASNMSFATFRYLERYNLLPENFNPQQYLEAATNVPRFHAGSQDIHHNSLPHRIEKKHSQLPPMKSKRRSTQPSSDMASNGHNFHSPLPFISNGHPKRHRNPSPIRQPSPRKQPHVNTPTSKILDITTLRQQPKLL